MLRLAALALALIWSGPAAADPIETGIGTANKAAEAIILTGPVGALFVLVVVGLVFALGAAGFVVRALWNTIKERDATIAALQDKRVAEQVESTKQVASTAISGAAAITASSDRLADVSSRISIMAERLLPVPEMVGDIKGRIGDIARSCGRGPA